MGPVTGRIRVLPECMDGSVIPAHFGHYVRVAAVIAQPGAVQGPGQGMVLAVADAVVRRSDAPFHQEAVGALFVGHGVQPGLEEVVLAVVAAARIPAGPVPGPDVILVLAAVPIPQIAQLLPQGVNGHAVQAVGAVHPGHQGLGVLIHLLGGLHQVPFIEVPTTLPSASVNVPPAAPWGQYPTGHRCPEPCR